MPVEYHALMLTRQSALLEIFVYPRVREGEGGIERVIGWWRRPCDWRTIKGYSHA